MRQAIVTKYHGAKAGVLLQSKYRHSRLNRSSTMCESLQFWRFIIGLMLWGMVCACESASYAPTTDASPSAIDTEAACAPCTIDVEQPGWRASQTIDYFTLTVRGLLPGRTTGDVCLLTMGNDRLPGTWTVADNGEQSGFPVVVRSDAPLSCMGGL